MMGKFDKILLCTDLDDTLLTSDKKVSDKNTQALKYFMDNGGLYTFATGRVPQGAKLIRKYIEPNTPMISYNGGAIYDFKTSEFIWFLELDDKAIEVLEYVDKNLPYAGIEASSSNSIYFCKVNHIVEEHKNLENFPDNYIDYHNLPEKLMKVIFMVEPWEMNGFKAEIAKTEFTKYYSFIQSSPFYYELLPYGSSKGAGLKKLKEFTHARFTIGMGDTENDISLVRDADLGIAVNNATPDVKAAADYITDNDHNHDAVWEIIEKLDKGILKFND